MTEASRRVRVLFDEAAIARRNAEIAEAIVAAKPENLLVVAVLKGSFMFAADLLRALHHVGLAPHVEFVHLSSYRTGTVSSGQVEILRDVQSEVRGRDVLLVDDILESGRTLVFAKDLLMARGARRVLTAVLLEKPGKRAVTMDAGVCLPRLSPCLRGRVPPSAHLVAATAPWSLRYARRYDGGTKEGMPLDILYASPYTSRNSCPLSISNDLNDTSYS